MPADKIAPEEHDAILSLLKRWHRALAEIDSANDQMRRLAANPASGIKSIDYEKARLVALAVVDQAGRGLAEEGVWPQLSDDDNSEMIAALRQQMNDAILCQLSLLRLWGTVTRAFRSGRENEAPPIEELVSLTNNYARILDEMGATAAQLAFRYNISGAELEEDGQG